MEEMTNASAGDITAREVADALWLARRQLSGERRPAPPRPVDEPDLPRPVGSTGTGGSDVALPPPPDPPVDTGIHADVPVVRVADRPRRATEVRAWSRIDRGVAKALRPLKQLVESASEHEVDEDSTAERAVVDSRWLPVVRPTEELRWDVVLVVDDSPTMALWRPTALRFAETLTRQGAFRNVQVRLLSEDGSGRLAVRGTARGAPRHRLSEVIDPSRRRIVLVLTDTGADRWRSGAVFSALRQWGDAHPVAIVHVLPWPSWHRVGLQYHRVRIRANEPGAPNARLRWVPQSAAPGVLDGLDDAMPVSVVELGSSGLARWARMTGVAGVGWTDIGAVLVPAKTVPVLPAPPPAVSTSPARLVADFRAMASPVAVELATYLAAAPLDLDVMERVREELLPTSEIAHLSEILGSGLVTPVPKEWDIDPDGVAFEFGPGVREELLAVGRRVSTAKVRRVVREFVGARVPSIHEFGSALDEKANRKVEDTDVSPDTERFLYVELATLEALSGIHLDEARTLRRLLERQRVQPNVPQPIRRVHDAGSLRSDRLTPSEVMTEPGGTEVTTTVDPKTDAPNPPGAMPVVWGGVPPRNPNFTGREDLLRELDDRLEPGATAAVLPEALHGLGGVGKTQLAVEYAYRYQSKFDVIWWIPAERTVQIVQSLVELGQRLDLQVGEAANVAVQPVLDALRGGGNRRIPSNWLLVYDNADSPEDVLPYLPTGGSGQILVTSRNSQWLTMARPLEVDVFQRRESKQLLQRRGPDLTDADAGRLAEALGDLPLAIAQAAAWRAETGMAADEYLELLEEQQIELLDVPAAPDYPRSVAAAWNLSLARMRRKNLSALRILQTCAFFAPEPVPRSMFSNGRGIAVVPELQRALKDKLRLNEAIRDINRYALARIDHRTNSIEMHRLVQAVLISQMPEQERSDILHGAHLLLGANDPDSPEDSDYWPKYAELNAHIVASNAIECEDQTVRDLVFNQARFLYHWGEHDASRELSQRIYDIWGERLGPDHLETLKVGRWLGFMLWMLGRYAEAVELNAEVLAAYRRTVGDDHEDAVEAIGAVAADNRAAGKFDTALRLSEENYERCIRLFGDDDPVTLNAAHNLGVSLRLAGKFRRAIELDEDTWGRKVQIFGTDHSLSLITQIGLTIDRRESGDYRGARLAHEDIVAIYRRIHDEKVLNPATLRAVRHLAVMRRMAGDYEGALRASEEALRGLTARYGADHPDTLAAALGRSIELRQSGDRSGAQRLGLETWDRYRRSLGDDHPHTLSAAVNVAVIRRFNRDYAAAKELDEGTVARFRARLGDDHPSTLVAQVNLASDHARLGEVQEAYDIGSRTVALAAVALGVDHPTTLVCQVNLSQDLIALDRRDEGETMRVQAVETLRQRLGSDHPDVLRFGDPIFRADCDIDPMPL